MAKKLIAGTVNLEIGSMSGWAYTQGSTYILYKINCIIELSKIKVKHLFVSFLYLTEKKW